MGKNEERKECNSQLFFLVLFKTEYAFFLATLQKQNVIDQASTDCSVKH